VDPIYQQLAGFLERKEQLAFAVLVETKGSTPQKCGAKAIFLPDGRILGTLGGGCLEAETRQKALRAIETGESFSFRAVLDDDFGWDDGLICGGSVQTFVQPNPGTSKVWPVLLSEPSKRQRRVLATVTTGDHIGKRALFTASELIVADDLPAELLSELSAKCTSLLAEPEPEPESLTLQPSSVSVYFEPILPQPVLVVCGGGHIGCSLGKIAAWSGFDVVAIDDRSSFANKERFPDAKQIIVDDPAKVMRDFPIDADTYVCIVTRGHKHDAVILKEIIHKSAAYIGMIGSKRKVRTVMDGFIAEGIATAEDFRRIRTPMGLAIHSLTVEEIAVSVLAELIAVRRNAQNFVSLSVTDKIANKATGSAKPERTEESSSGAGGSARCPA
jgi:xanthine dehydrogenase accessory factor